MLPQVVLVSVAFQAFIAREHQALVGGFDMAVQTWCRPKLFVTLLAWKVPHLVLVNPFEVNPHNILGAKFQVTNWTIGCEVNAFVHL